MIRQSILLAGAMLAAQAAQAAEAGKIIFVAGNAQVLDKPAVLGAMVNEGELLSTGADGYVYVKTVDNGLFILRPNTKARIASYHVDAKNPANTRIKLELLSGVARSQSGEAVKLARQNFRFNTPVAAIGVRGTDFTVFTDQDTSRVAVISGGITISGFVGGCRPEGSGPCEGNTSRELTAAQKGQLLQVQRGQAAPQLMQGNSLLAPDTVAPPRSDEPAGKGGNSGAPGTSSTEPSLDVKKNLALQNKIGPNAVDESKTNPGNTGGTNPVSPPPVVDVQPLPPPALPVREISWGRWATVLGEAPTSGIEKAGADRIAMNEYFVLFRSREGAAFVAPERGSLTFGMSDSAAYMKDVGTQEKLPVTLANGYLQVNFDTSNFATGFDVNTGTGSYAMAGVGKVGKDGLLGAQSKYLPSANLNISGALTNMNSAAYLFQGSLDERRSVSGIAEFKR
ncbi:FecR family protein [Rugamonas rubra]|uniref:FecR family protein n=1 Tax=Rugamonas rubra TaxID=758825 RepID=A0A1I4I3H4_9BURK|nr:FecR domain-containing protein [Rugamonas rubra]SFL48925.1 FecR family protein [Rugamonas rubra]